MPIYLKFEQDVSLEQGSRRLDQYLCQKNLGQSRSQIQKWIETGAVLVKGKAVKASYLLKPGDEISIEIPAAEPIDAKPEALPLLILYEDEELAVISKSADQVVHAAVGHSEGTLVNALLYHLKNLSPIGGKLRPGIVHRLDKGTSGVMLVAKTNAAHLELVRQFQARAIEKTYLAIAYGLFNEQTGVFDKALGRSRSNRKKIASKTSRAKEALTHYKVLGAGEHLSFVQLKPKTGRTHQLRVHLAEAGHPIVGDPLYGGKQWLQKFSEPLRQKIVEINHQLLHARKIRFLHPLSKKEMEFEVEVPKDFREILSFVYPKPTPVRQFLD